VIEQRNLAPHLLIAEIDRIVQDAALRAAMSTAAKAFARPDAARKIAKLLLEITISHEPV
jgi:UDP-N-acetylglucosamine:LPS N-acetylglucosamine transferase